MAIPLKGRGILLPTQAPQTGDLQRTQTALVKAGGEVQKAKETAGLFSDTLQVLGAEAVSFLDSFATAKDNIDLQGRFDTLQEGYNRHFEEQMKQPDYWNFNDRFDEFATGLRDELLQGLSPRAQDSFSQKEVSFREGFRHQLATGVIDRGQNDLLVSSNAILENAVANKDLEKMNETLDLMARTGIRSFPDVAIMREELTHNIDLRSALDAARLSSDGTPEGIQASMELVRTFDNTKQFTSLDEDDRSQLMEILESDYALAVRQREKAISDNQLANNGVAMESLVRGSLTKEGLLGINDQRVPGAPKSPGLSPSNLSFYNNEIDKIDRATVLAAEEAARSEAEDYMIAQVTDESGADISSEVFDAGLANIEGLTDDDERRISNTYRIANQAHIQGNIEALENETLGQIEYVTTQPPSNVLAFKDDIPALKESVVNIQDATERAEALRNIEKFEVSLDAARSFEQALGYARLGKFEYWEGQNSQAIADQWITDGQLTMLQDMSDKANEIEEEDLTALEDFYVKGVLQNIDIAAITNLGQMEEYDALLAEANKAAGGTGDIFKFEQITASNWTKIQSAIEAKNTEIKADRKEFVTNNAEIEATNIRSSYIGMTVPQAKTILSDLTNATYDKDGNLVGNQTYKNLKEGRYQFEGTGDHEAIQKELTDFIQFKEKEKVAGVPKSSPEALNATYLEIMNPNNGLDETIGVINRRVELGLLTPNDAWKWTKVAQDIMTGEVQIGEVDYRGLSTKIHDSYIPYRDQVQLELDAIPREIRGGAASPGFFIPGQNAVLEAIFGKADETIINPAWEAKQQELFAIESLMRNEPMNFISEARKEGQTSLGAESIAQDYIKKANTNIGEKLIEQDAIFRARQLLDAFNAADTVGGFAAAYVSGTQNFVDFKSGKGQNFIVIDENNPPSDSLLNTPGMTYTHGAPELGKEQAIFARIERWKEINGEMVFGNHETLVGAITIDGIVKSVQISGVVNK